MGSVSIIEKKVRFNLLMFIWSFRITANVSILKKVTETLHEFEQLSKMRTMNIVSKWTGFWHMKDSIGDFTVQCENITKIPHDGF